MTRDFLLATVAGAVTLFVVGGVGVVNNGTAGALIAVVLNRGGG